MRSRAAALVCGVMVALAAPAVAVDNDLMNPNDCDFGGASVSSGTVVYQPPGSPTKPDGSISTDPTTVVNGVPQGNLYMCVGGRWVLVGTAHEAGPVQSDASSVTVDEGSEATMSGSVAAGETGPATDLTASVGTAELFGGAVWDWTGTPDDGPAVLPVVIGATIDGVQRTGGFVVDVANVAPTITSLTPQTPMALLGQEVTFVGTATDPSGADTAAGFTWDLGPTSFDTCGSHTVTGTATDKDAGVSAPFISAPVTVAGASYAAPLAEGARKVVRAGQVVPVRVVIGCQGQSLGGLTPSIRLLAGDVDPATTADDPAVVVPATGATGDTSGLMRETGGAYVYNLRVPSAPSGSLFTVRVRPAATGGAVNAVLQIR